MSLLLQICIRKLVLADIHFLMVVVLLWLEGHIEKPAFSGLF